MTCLVWASSAEMSINPCTVERPTRPKNPFVILPRLDRTSPIGPTSDPAERRSTPPSTSTRADDCSISSVARRSPLVTTTSPRRSTISCAR